jgi:hypothetical protein
MMGAVAMFLEEKSRKIGLELISCVFVYCHGGLWSCKGEKA